jgi:pyruvate dehydrogenase kinase 2/3/4
MRKEMPAKKSNASLFGDFFGFLEAPSKRGGYSSLFPSFQTMEPHQVPDIQNLQPDMLSPKSEDLENIVFGSECRDPVLVQRASKHVNKLFDILERAVQRHKPIVLLTAKEVSKLEKTMQLDPTEVQQFLSKFHHQRIAVRLLIGHCVALSRPLPLDSMIGIFCTKTPVEEIVLESVALAEEMSLLTYGCVPPVELSCTPSSSSTDLLYIPSHFQHIIFELVKNSMRAVIEKEQERVGTDGIVNTAALPPIMIHWDINEKVP